MRSQTDVSTAAVQEKIRTLGLFEVTRGLSYEADLARQLDMPDFTPTELADKVEYLVDTGKVFRYDKETELEDTGGITKDPVSDKVFVFTVVPPK